MFQRTFASLGQAVGWRKGQPAHEVEPAVEDERRIWVRYPCEVDATCQPANQTDAMRLSARVRNVSVGGINFLLNCPVECGSLVSVELPGLSRKTISTVLAYVVRVEPSSEGDWSVGCTFATELTDDDLAPFGVARKPSHVNDQRAWVRFPCDVRASFQFVKAVEPTTWSAQVVNMSANGLGLVVDESVDLGKLLNLELRAIQGDYTLGILACVVRHTPEADGRFTLGCNLIRELTDKEIKSLLNHR
jgi:hypothetical protein